MAAAARLTSGILAIDGDTNLAMTAANVGDRATMPDLKTSLEQVESKFKHANDFGVSTPRGAQGSRTSRMRSTNSLRIRVKYGCTGRIAAIR